MRDLIVWFVFLMMMAPGAWGGDLSDIATAENFGLDGITADVISIAGDVKDDKVIERPCPREIKNGDFPWGYEPHPYEECLESRIAALEAQVKELRQQVLPISCLEYYQEINDISKLWNPPDGAVSRMSDNGLAFYKIKEECK